MKSFDTWLDRFCRKHPNFTLPNLMMYVVIGNVLVFLMDQFSGGTFSGLLSFNRAAIFSGEIWRLRPEVKDEEELVRRLLELYEVEEPELRKDVADFLDSLRKLGIL